MAGIIQNQMPDDESDPSAAGAPPDAGAPPPDTGALPEDDAPDDSDGAPPAAGGNKITAESIEAKLHLNPEQREQLERIIVAGMKIMFDPKTHQLMVAEIKKPGPIEQKLGQSIVGLLGLLVKESQNSLPPDLLIPAGMVLLVHAAEFLNQAGVPIDDKAIGSAIEVMITVIAQQFHIDPDKLAAVGAGTLKPGAPAAPGPASGAAVPPPPGVIGGAMPPQGAPQ